LLVRKVAHLSEYSIFAACIEQKVWAEQKSSGHLGHVAGMIYVVGDELHQSFVPSRSASPLDVLIDTIGFAFGMFCFYIGHAICSTKSIPANTDFARLKEISEILEPREVALA
jgi:VanZ family protein